MIDLRLATCLSRCLGGLLLLLGFLGGSGCADGPAGAQAAGSAAGAPEVRPGMLRTRLFLTGELAAARAVELKVPRTRSSELRIRWLERDGSPVRAGQPVVELDNSEFAAELEEKRLKASQASDELTRKAAEVRSAGAEKEFEVQKKRSELARARIRARVAEGIVATREVQERQLDLRRAEAALEKAEAELEAHRQASAAELEMQRINLERARREIREAEEAIAALSLKAPREGLFLVSQTWEGRKLQEGDSVWAGQAVAFLPDLSSLVVEAGLSDVDDGRLVPGGAASCILDAYPSEPFGCRVGEIAPVAREEASYGSLRRYFPVRLSLERTDPRMRPGMSVRVEVLGPETPGLIAPRAALDLSASPPRALLAGGGSAEVRLGACNAAECIVESGLERGARLRLRGGDAP